MRLHDIYSDPPVISVEFFPPKTEEGDARLAERIPAIKRLRPDYVSVTYGAGGSNRDRTLGWVRRLKEEFDLDVMCHLTCVGQSRAELEAVLDQLQEMNVDKIIALRGDPPRGTTEWRPHPEGFRHAVELVRLAAGRGFSVAVAGFPEIHPESESRESDLAYLKQKVDAGAESITTQLFFDNDAYYRFVEGARAIGITVPIVPGILPFRTVSELRRFCNVYSRTKNGPARIPEELEACLADVENDDAAAEKLGIDFATAQCRELLDNGAPGLHFFCLNESRIVETIMSRLQLRGHEIAVGGE